MSAQERVTVTLPDDLVRGIDRREKNRSKFVADAVRRELARRRREDLQRSVRSPHPESETLAGENLQDWSRTLPEEDVDSLLNPSAGKPVRWIPGQGWVEDNA